MFATQDVKTTATSNGEHKMLLNPFRFLQFKCAGTERGVGSTVRQQTPFPGAHSQTLPSSPTDEFGKARRQRCRQETKPTPVLKAPRGQKTKGRAVTFFTSLWMYLAVCLASSVLPVPKGR